MHKAREVVLVFAGCHLPARDVWGYYSCLGTMSQASLSLLIMRVTEQENEKRELTAE